MTETAEKRAETTLAQFTADLRGLLAQRDRLKVDNAALAGALDNAARELRETADWLKRIARNDAKAVATVLAERVVVALAVLKDHGPAPEGGETSTAPRKAPAKADPEAIDLAELSDLLDRLRAWQYWEKTGHNYNVLTETIAAVEALRNQGTELESELEQAIKWQQFYMNKAEAAEARALLGMKEPLS